jgi:hypothetical protein
VKSLAFSLLLVCSPATAHTGRTAEDFTFTGTEKAIEGDAGSGSTAVVTSFSTNLEYGDGHRESASGKCTVSKNPPGAAFGLSGVCVAPGVYTMEFHCQAAVGEAEVNCWGSLTGAPESHHNGLTGLVTYQTGPEGVAGVGRWNGL